MVAGKVYLGGMCRGPGETVPEVTGLGAGEQSWGPGGGSPWAGKRGWGLERALRVQAGRRGAGAQLAGPAGAGGGGSAPLTQAASQCLWR